MDITYLVDGYIDDTYFVYTADANSQLTVSSTVTAELTPITIPNYYPGIQSAEAQLTSTFILTRAVLDGTTRYIDPYIISGSNYSGIGFDSNIKKFGSSLRFDARTAGGLVDLGPVYGNGKFLALNIPLQIVDAEPSYSFSSTDGITWTSALNNLPADNYSATTWGKLYFVNNQFVVDITDNSSQYFYTSTDGVSWTQLTSTSNFHNTITKITFVNGLYVLTSGNQIYKSTNLTTWTGLDSLYTPGYVDTLWDVSVCEFTYVNPSTGFNTTGKAIVAAGSDSVFGPIIAYSRIENPDGLTRDWRTSIVYLPSSMPPVWASKKWLATANDGYNFVFVGTGGIIGTITTDDIDFAFSATNNQAAIYLRTSNTTDDIISVAYADGQFVARTATNKILVSSTSNLNSWTVISPTFTSPNPSTPWVDPTVNIDINQYVNGLTYGNNTWIAGGYYSNSSINSWTNIDWIGQLPNQQPSVYYVPGNYLNLWKTLDFWLYITPSTKQSITGILWQQDVNSRATFDIGFSTNNGSPQNSAFYINEYDTNGNSLGSINTSNVLPAGSWNHIRVVNNGSQGAIFANGSRISTFTLQGTLGYINSPMYIGRWLNDIQYSRPTFYIDEFLLTKDVLTQPTDTSYTVPTTPWSNGPNVNALFHFDNSVDDDNLPWNGAYLTATTSLTASLGHVQSVQAQLSVSTSLIAQGIRTKQFAELMSDTCTLTANATRIRHVSAQLTATTSLTGVEQVKDTVQAHLTSTSSISAVLGHVVQTTAYLTSTSSLTSNATKFRTVSAQLNSSSTITATYDVYALILDGASLQSSTTIHANTIKTAIFAGHLASQSNLFAELDNVATTKQGAANLSSTSTFYATYGKLRIDTSIVWYIEHEDREWMIAPEILSNYIITH